MRQLISLAVFALVLAPTADAVAAPTDTAGCSPTAVTRYHPPASNDMPFGVVADRGGAWVAHGSDIDRFRSGRIVAYPIPDGKAAGAGWLTDDGHGTIWFAERGTGRLGTITGTGTITQYEVPRGPNRRAVPQAIVLRPGAVWFTDQANDRLGRLDLASGTYAFFPVPTGDPLGLVQGHDGDLYFTERSVDKVGRFDPRTAAFTEWPLSAGAFPNRLTVDPAGNVWFTELRTSMLGRIDPAGRLHESPLAGGPVGITYSNGMLYAAMAVAGALDEISPTGRLVRSWSLPGANTVLQVSVRDGVAWVTDGFANHVYRVDTACPSSA